MISIVVQPSAISWSRRGRALATSVVLARRARRLDGGDDAAAGAGDLLVARALQAQLELVRPVAAIDEMRVAVDEPGGDPAALAVDSLARIPAGGQVRRRAGKGDPAVLGSDGAVLDDPEAVILKRSKASIEPDPVEAHVPAPV